jgi:hypothetical protein
MFMSDNGNSSVTQINYATVRNRREEQIGLFILMSQKVFSP